MESNFHLVEQRLGNIKTIKPLLMSLRTISLSSWKLSLNKLNYLNKFYGDLDRSLGNVFSSALSDSVDPEAESAMLVFGSSRGLCGSFNRDLFSHLKYFLKDHPQENIKFIIFGEKIRKLFEKNDLAFDEYLEYPKASAIDYQYVNQVIDQIFSTNIPPLLLLYNNYHGSSKYQAALQRILPAIAFEPAYKSKYDDLIIDGDHAALVRFHQKQTFLIAIYKAFLSSFAAEHSQRFQIMESSLSNIDKLIQELTISVQVERQKRVTSEMRELSISAGLLEK